jgi:hypothetical protein
LLWHDTLHSTGTRHTLSHLVDCTRPTPPNTTSAVLHQHTSVLQTGHFLLWPDSQGVTHSAWKACMQGRCSSCSPAAYGDWQMAHMSLQAAAAAAGSSSSSDVRCHIYSRVLPECCMWCRPSQQLLISLKHQTPYYHCCTSSGYNRAIST